ncbi:hypothetical protein M5689_011372 [Euphorbia peplus]|nr:hypothetical protein M5689_011372 [Euphorbia peplus]
MFQATYGLPKRVPTTCNPRININTTLQRLVNVSMLSLCQNPRSLHKHTQSLCHHICSLHLHMFHHIEGMRKVVAVKKCQVEVQSMQINGNTSFNMEIISDHVVSYYSNLFKGIASPVNLDCVSQVNPSSVSETDNDFLTRCPTDE